MIMNVKYVLQRVYILNKTKKNKQQLNFFSSVLPYEE